MAYTLVLETSAFGIEGSTPSLRTMSSKEYHRAYSRQHYIDNKEMYKEKAHRHRSKSLERNRQLILERYSAGCTDCGNADIRVLEFDHRDPALKKFSIARRVRDVSTKKLTEELDKCDVVCANCHRIHTMERGGHWNSIQRLLEECGTYSEE